MPTGLLLSGRGATGSPWLPVPSRSRAPVEHPLEGQAVRRRDLRRGRTVARPQDPLDRIRFERAWYTLDDATRRLLMLLAKGFQVCICAKILDLPLETMKKRAQRARASLDSALKVEEFRLAKRVPARARW